MNHRGNLLRQPLLQRPQMGRGIMLGDKRFDGFAVQEGENPDIALGVLVADVEPELIELVRRRIARVEPHVAALGLAELGAVGLGNQGAGDGERLGFGTQLAADELGARGDVAPLVGTAELDFAVHGLVEVQKVVALHELVGEFGERHAVALAVETLLDRILGHHIIDRNALADVADEIEERKLLHPVVVVDHDGGVGSVGLEIEQFGQLALDGLLVVTQRLLVEQVALLRLARGVADHARSAPDEGQRTMAAQLEVLENHHADQVADMQRIGRGVDAQIGRGHLFFELFLGSRHDGVDHPAPFEFFDKILFHICFHFIPFPNPVPCEVRPPADSSR